MPDIDAFFGKEGLLGALLKGYKPRPGQVSLAKSIYDTIRDDKHLLSEAPTGTGKSISYLVPSIFHVMEKENIKRICVVTSSIVLQEQLIKKDLPLLQEAFRTLFPEEIKFCLVKGLGNYLCKQAADEAAEEDVVIPELIAHWIATTKTGDKSEMRDEPPVPLWSQLSVSGEECLKGGCPHYGDCFALQARRSDAQIIVTNYHLFYFNAVVGGQLLPPYDVAILDEAHKAAEIAMDFQGFELYHSRLSWLARRVRGMAYHGVEDAAKFIEDGARDFFRRVAQDKAERRERFLTKPLGYDGGLVVALRAANAIMNTAVNEAEKDSLEGAKFKRMARNTAKQLHDVQTVCFGECSEIDDDLEAGGLKIENRLPGGSVFYFEEDRNKGTGIHCKVIDVQDFLREQVFGLTPVIAVSATLTSGGNFEFTANNLGLDADEYVASIAPSPFDPQRVLLVIPSDIPEPTPANKESHSKAVANLVTDIAEALKGRTMGLFTTYRNLNATAQKARERLSGINIMVQGEMSKSRIVQDFRANENSLVLGTASFWEGIDIPGRSLTCLVIDKIPFVPPDDPVLWYLEHFGGQDINAFFDNSVPRATIAMKQGIGRLIRTETDYGVIVLCDKRLVTKRYGGTILSAAPSRSQEDTCWINNEVTSKGCVDVIKSFLDEYGG